MCRPSFTSETKLSWSPPGGNSVQILLFIYFINKLIVYIERLLLISRVSGTSTNFCHHVKAVVTSQSFFFSTVDCVTVCLFFPLASHSPEHKHLGSADPRHASRLQTSRFSSARLLHLLLSVFWRRILGGGGFAQRRKCTGHICGDAGCLDERPGCVFCLATVVQESGNTCWSTVFVVPLCDRYHTKSARYYHNCIQIILTLWEEVHISGPVNGLYIHI